MTDDVEAGAQSSASALQEAPWITYKRRRRFAGVKRSFATSVGTDSEGCESAEVGPGGEDEEARPPNHYASCPKKQALLRDDDESDIYSLLKCPSVMHTWKALLGIRRTYPPRRRVCGQYFLDLGQKDFSRSQCSVCGLLYAKGEENDEKLHKAFHRSQTQGILFKGWKTERVVGKLDCKGTRVICVLPDDPFQHQIKVKEVAAVVEAEMGLLPGWLLETQCKVYLYISAGKKVVGCIMAEPIQEAFEVVPWREECGDEQESDGSKVTVGKQDQHLRVQDCGKGAEPWLRNVAVKPEVPDPPRCGTAAVSLLSPCTRDKLEDVHIQELAPARLVLKNTKVTDYFLKAGRQKQLGTQKPNPSKRASFAGASARTTSSRLDDSQHIHSSTLDDHTGYDHPSTTCVSHMLFSGNSCPASRSRSGSEKASHSKSEPADTSDASIPQNTLQRHPAQKDILLFGNVKFKREVVKRTSCKEGREQKDSGRPIMCSKVPVAAVCGVRCMWVSQSERRKGIASRLLDAMRKTFTMGFVLQPHQVAFSQPTPDGQAFALRYCRTDKFLVYG